MLSADSYLAPSLAVIAATTTLLAYMGLKDSRTFRIHNRSVLFLAVLFLLYAGISGQWATLAWNVAFATLMFGILLLPYRYDAIGGGDIKMLTVAFLWTGLHCALLFSLLLFGFGVLSITAVKLGLVDAPIKNGRTRIAYGPTISAALIVTILLGCLSANS
jgi:prepilin peptidase CpaA